MIAWKCAGMRNRCRVLRIKQVHLRWSMSALFCTDGHAALLLRRAETPEAECGRFQRHLRPVSLRQKGRLVRLEVVLLLAIVH